MDVSMLDGDILILYSNDFEESVLLDMFKGGCETILERDCFNRTFAVRLRRKTAADGGTTPNKQVPGGNMKDSENDNPSSSVSDDYIAAMRDAREFAAKENLELECAARLSKILDRIDAGRRA